MSDTVHVLLVDEDTEVLDITQTFLERSDDALDVTAIENAQAALERARSGEFDCVVSDYKMPRMDGLTLHERIRESGSDLPFFLFTAKSGVDIEREVEAAGATGYVQKGTGTEQYDELAARIREAV
jgi:CheY-like chemotaxis protein